MSIKRTKKEVKMDTLKITNINYFPDKLVQSFDIIPDDKYLKTDFPYRKRCYGTGTIKDGVFYWDENDIFFMQSKELNSYVGGITRNFAKIASLIKEDICEKVVMNAYRQLPASDYKVGIHQIRILANTINQGIPTPEGIHQDGFDYVTVTCINTFNVSGGISVLLDAKDHTKIVFEGTLYPGMQIIFSDKTFAHYTSNITPKVPGIAFRDVIVVTFAAK